MKKDNPDAFLFRFKETDALNGICLETFELLCETLNMSKTDVMHFALKQLEERFNTQTVSP